MQKDPRNHVESVGQAYSEAAKVYDDLFVDRRARAENAYVTRLLQVNGYLDGRVLDVGSGTGLLLELAGAHIKTNDYLGVDLAPGMVEVARKKFPHRAFMVGDMADLGVAGRFFSSVVSLFCCFSYCTKPEAAVGEFHRALLPGGRVMVMVYGGRTGRKGAYHVTGHPLDRRIYQAYELKWLFQKQFNDVKVHGLSILNDRLPQWLPQGMFDFYTTAEANTAGYADPDRGYFLIAEGVKS